MSLSPPCYNCNRRKHLCHSKCELYKAYRKDLDEVNEADRQMKNYKEYICERMIKSEKWSKNHERK